MLSIYKYQLSRRSGRQDIELPQGCRILTMQAQYDNLCLWAVVNPQASLVKYRFYKLYTGDPFEHVPGEFVGTAQFDGGKQVVHVFRARLVETFSGTFVEV